MRTPAPSSSGARHPQSVWRSQRRLPRMPPKRAKPGFFGRHDKILLYVPNLIGYLRVGFALYGLSVGLTQPVQCMVCYALSFVCDDLDGRFARALGQTSTLGAVLDMVTDRLGTSGLLMLLAVLYPSYLPVVLALVFLDIFSHWFQMYSTLLVGATSHKDTKSASWLVRTYYKYRLFMGFCCVCCEVLYLSLYGLNFPALANWRIKELPLTIPAELNDLVAQVQPGLLTLLDGKGLPVLALLALLALPGFTVKQICNWAQLRASADLLVQADLKKIKS